MTNRILIIYGTTEGQTRKIAGAIGETLRPTGLEVDVWRAKPPFDDPDPNAYDAVIVAASVHAGGYQRPVTKWVRAHAAELAAKPTAFVSVCLGVLEHNPKTDAVLAGIMDKFFEATGWHPPVTRIFAGALPYTRYNWLTRRLMRRIVAKANGDVDTSRDYEYTNWDDVRAFALEFYQSRVHRPQSAA